jgi:hypothetical protein
MTISTFNECLVTRTADATQISNTTTETIVVPDYTFAANYFYQGRTIRGVVKGKCSNVVTTPGTLTYRIRMGTTTLSSTLVVASPALGLDTTARTDYPWELSFTLVCRTSGTSGTAQVMGKIEQANVLSSTATNLLPQFIPTPGAAAGTLNTEVANLLSVSAQFSVATSPTNLTAQQYILEALT